MARIGKLSQIPDWFNLDNYNAMADCEADHWLYEFSVRQTYYCAPLTCALSENKRNVFFRYATSCDKAHQSDLLNGTKRFKDVSTIVNGEVVFLGLATSGKEFSNLKLVRNKTDSPIQMLSSKGGVTLNDQMKGASSTTNVISVNLLTPDEVLVQWFKAYLKASRRSMQKNELLSHIIPFSRDGRILKFKKSNFKKWGSCGLLPFLDLYQWSLLTGNTITNPVFGEALFPGRDQGDKSQRIKDTTRLHAKSALKIEQVLRNQICGHWEKK